MAIRSLTSNDIPANQRRENASKSIHILRERLTDNSLTLNQKNLLTEQMSRLEQWVSGS